MKFRPIIIILFISLLGSFQVSAAVKWNNSDDKSNVYNRELLDVGLLNQEEVPKIFPDYRITADESCKSTNDSWSNRITLDYSEDFLWSQSSWSQSAYIYEGKLKGTNKFEIQVGEVDLNRNNEITAKVLHAYVQKNIVKQSNGKQAPELQGAENRVLVRFE